MRHTEHRSSINRTRHTRQPRHGAEHWA